MSVTPSGLHHVTAIASDPQQNLDFYFHVLGLRLIKQTVNFDAPDVYHLYYGDETGTPGTILTFFPWPNAPRGRRGTGQATSVGFSIPPASAGWWAERLHGLGVGHEVVDRGGEDVVVLHDPDDLRVELVASTETDERIPWEDGPISTEHAIRGLHGITLTEARDELTVATLAETLGFRLVGEDGGRARFDVGAGGPGARLDLVVDPSAGRGHVAAGTVHHVAWRAPDDAAQLAWRSEIADAGLQVTQVLERQYFHSIYFREPGGVLFEIATDAPGFTTDETVAELGHRLQVPPWLAHSREEIARGLQELKLPTGA